MNIQPSLWENQACVKYVLKHTYNRQSKGWPPVSGTDAGMCLHLGRVVLILTMVTLPTHSQLSGPTEMTIQSS